MRVLLIAVLCLAAFGASQPWAKDPAQWTPEDTERVLNDSPWSQRAMAAFGQPLEPDDMPNSPPPGAEGNLPGNNRRGASDGRWDGGVSRNVGTGESPELPVTIRWDSALPIRQALSRSRQDNTAAARAGSEYIVTVIGLAPTASSKPAPSQEDAGDTPQREPQDPAQIAQAFMSNSRLIVHDKTIIQPDDAKYDPASGAVTLFFSRSAPITLGDKEIVLTTRFGSVRVQKRFRLKDMTYKGQLQL